MLGRRHAPRVIRGKEIDVASSAGPFDRQAAYRRLSRILFPQRYIGKILLLTFIAAHIPLLALVAYTLVASPFDGTVVARVLVVGFSATLAGAGLALAGLWVLLTPVVKASEALETYRSEGIRRPLPTDLGDEGGRLMANVHGTLEGLDSTIARLNVLATHDDLTGVYNRREGTRRLLDELDGGGGGSGATLILIDVDNLKWINDQWGHSVGDRVLQLLAEAIARRVEDHGWVSRWGGDEFVVVVREAGFGGLAEQLVESVRHDLERVPVRVDGGGEFRIRLSTGVARHEPGDDAQGMFNRADQEFYQAKQMRGRAEYHPPAASFPDQPVS